MQICRITRRWFVFTASLFVVTECWAQLPTTPAPLSAEQRTQLHDLVSRVLSHANQVRCGAGRCDVLVANFIDSKGDTSILGMQLAEEVSKDDSFVTGHIRTTPRYMLQSYFESQRIPSTVFKDFDATRWLGRELSADAVLVGNLKLDGPNLKVELRLVECWKPRDRESRKSKAESATLTLPGGPTDLTPSQPFGELPTPTRDGEVVPKFGESSGANGHPMKAPSCSYQPDPSYTDDARWVKFNGTLILQVIISKDGEILDVRPQRGAPFGLNRVSVEAVRTWKCNPAILDGKPITTAVPVEVSFRLF